MWVVLERKVFHDRQAVKVGDSAIKFAIHPDLDHLKLIGVYAAVTTTGSGTTTVQLRNSTRALDMLSTRITIDGGEFTSRTAAVPAVINKTGATPVHKVFADDIIHVDVDTAGAAAKGLEVHLTLGQDTTP